ncbi:class I SAM-dependent methyltransferase [Acuticoccus yangtzensis]|uniref:class I SAM-dependent methyltransferase n=1 Tax=Acuticoccus yangtzensis TaxID=1443441 RepID=UPI000A8C0FCE|nr:class I SAM-dependent methyltransferase [Acuticoccus yangtzensis]
MTSTPPAGPGAAPNDPANDPNADPNSDQRTFWNSPAGDKWVRYQEELDGLFTAITARLVTLLSPTPGMNVVDIGCGAGDLALTLAPRVASVTGVDLSVPLLTRARARADAAGLSNAAFIEADAQSHAFASPIDAVVSRFGVMFFADPVAAFANIRAAMRPGAPLVFATWAGLQPNPWFAIPRAAAVDRLGAVPPDAPREPGPMAFEEPAYVEEILTAAGFGAIGIDTATVDLHHPSFADAVALSVNVGPASRILRSYDGTDEDVAAIQQAIAAAFAPFRRGDAIAVPACLHFVSAKAP